LRGAAIIAIAIHHSLLFLPYQRSEAADFFKTLAARFALQNASSVAGLLLTTEAMVAEKPEKKKPSDPPMPTEDMY
jgi:hypothetical protein